MAQADGREREMKRFDIYWSDQEVQEEPEGYWVAHAEASAIIATKDAEIAELKRQRDELLASCEGAERLMRAEADAAAMRVIIKKARGGV